MNANKYGIYAGLAMVIILALLSVTGDYNIGFIKYVKYIALFIFLCIANLSIREKLRDRKYFGEAMGMGFRLSAIAGVFLLGATVVLFVINPSFAPMKFNFSPDTLVDSFIIGSIIFFETLVFGTLINFVLIQFIKPGAETVQQ